MELKTLYAAISLGDRAAAADVMARIVESGRTILRSNFYTVLNALERKGHVVSGVDRGTTRGRRHNVRVLTVTEAGVAAAAAERRMYAVLARGAEDRLDRSR
jgi:DNA-binding PadR family transcriptional regulator